MVSPEFIWQIVSYFITIVIGSSGGALIYHKINKKKELALAKQQESIADQEREQAKAKEIENTKGIIEVYKNALDDTVNLYENRIKSLTENVESQARQIKSITEEYDKKLREMKDQIQSLTDNAINNCSNCEFKDTCKKHTIISKLLIDGK